MFFAATLLRQAVVITIYVVTMLTDKLLASYNCSFMMLTLCEKTILPNTKFMLHMSGIQNCPHLIYYFMTVSIFLELIEYCLIACFIHKRLARSLNLQEIYTIL